MNCKPLLATIVLLTGCCEKHRPAPSVTPMTQPIAATQPASRFTGILHGGIIAVGAETTGWVLETEPGKRVDLDVSKVVDAATKLDGKTVVVQGEMTTANWLERGEKPLLIADRIESAE